MIDANLGDAARVRPPGRPARERAGSLARYRLQLVDPTDGSGLSQVLGRLETGS